jgi:hypothetical protein
VAARLQRGLNHLAEFQQFAHELTFMEQRRGQRIDEGLGRGRKNKRSLSLAGFHQTH